MKFSIIFLTAIFALSFAFAPPAQAGECFEHPAITLNGSATVKSGVFVRSAACMEGSEVTASLNTGEVVATTKYDDGWYEIKRADGTSGWVWGDFLTVSADPIAFEEKEPVEEKEPETDLNPADTVSLYHDSLAKNTSNALLERLKGRILLQVENHGEAWYVHPDTGYRYYMKDGPTAYEMMRAFGLGITDEDLKKIGEASVSSFASIANGCSTDIALRMRGKILLQVEQHGEAWYVHPENCMRVYMKDGAAAYSIMRELSLGITNNDLSTISSKEFSVVPYVNGEQPDTETILEEPTASGASDSLTSTNFQDIYLSSRQEGAVPSKMDLVALNEYWLERINALRAQKGLREIVLDQRFVDTASEYAAYMYEAQAYAHERPDGGSMHDWIDAQNLDFTLRYSLPDGWKDNYFTENISWGYSDNSLSGGKTVLDQAMSMFLAEASYNGPHYRTIYHSDWNTVGVGFYFEPLGNDDYKVYAVYHYGSLVSN